MDDRNDAINVRVLVEKTGLLRCFRNEFCDRARAVHRGENANVVPGACLAIGAAVTLKGAGFVCGGQSGVLTCVTVILVVLTHTKIVNVHMFASVDVCLRLTDDLSVSINVFARWYVTGRYFMAARNCKLEGHEKSRRGVRPRPDRVAR